MDTKRYIELVQRTIDEKLTSKERFEASVMLARESGVPEDNIIKSIEEIDSYFMD